MLSAKEIGGLMAIRAKDFDLNDQHQLNHYAECLDFVISAHVQDVLKAVKNINETSINNSDRWQRLIDLEEKYEVSKTHIF